MRILVVEDEQTVATFIQSGLEQEGYAVDVLREGTSAGEQAPLSKDAVSRLTGRLAGDFAAWRSRDLADEQIRYLFLDGWYRKSGWGNSACGCRRPRSPSNLYAAIRRATGETPKLFATVGEFLQSRRAAITNTSDRASS